MSFPGLRRSFIVGVLVAVMLLTKQTSLFILPALLLYCILAGLCDRDDKPAYIRFGLVIGGVLPREAGKLGKADPEWWWERW
jgi:hypothetical protein